MSKSMNMLRTRRRDNNVKPNRRLDRKSSRGMIYENEELRLKTININAEIERGQSDIKKLRRENEMLKKEIWCLRDEYEKLDKLLKTKEGEFSSSSSCSSDSSESGSSCTEESEEVEASQNLENYHKTTKKQLHVEFDHLSIVPEENSTDTSDKNSPNRLSINNDIIKPDQEYPKHPKHFFAPINYPAPPPPTQTFHANNNHHHLQDEDEIEPTMEKAASDIIVKTDNHHFANRSSFTNGGNLEDLLNDIETISQDILKITGGNDDDGSGYKSELNVVLMPQPMPLIGFEKYEQLKANCYNFAQPNETEQPLQTTNSFIENFDVDFACTKTESSEKIATPNILQPPKVYNDEMCSSRSNLLEMTSSDQISSENEEKRAKSASQRKVSIHFKGKKNKNADEAGSKPTANRSSEPKSSSSDPALKRASQSPENKATAQPHEKKSSQHKKHKRIEKAKPKRRSLHRDRSFSVCTDRSNFFEHNIDEYMTSDRERTNSLSSCGTGTVRKMSNISNIPVGGKIPWCGCWGNGCL